MNVASGSHKLMIFLVITALFVALIYGSSSSFYLSAELPDSRFAGIQSLAPGQSVLPQEQESVLQEQPQVVINGTQVGVDASKVSSFMKIVEPFIVEFEKRNPTLKIGADGMGYNRALSD